MSRAFVVSLAMLAVPAAAQEGIAVLAVDTSAQGDATGDPSPAAEAVRLELSKRGARVISQDETRVRLHSLGVETRFELSAYEARLQAAEDAYAALDTERSLEILGAVLRDLSSDADVSNEKQQLLERSRVRAAARLMALAGPSEKGEADTPLGKRALSHLVAALRTNPTLVLSEQEHPPKMRRLHARAQAAMQRQGLGGLSVETTPAGATVYVEGRAVGVTPLRLTKALPHGRHRVWVALDDARSVTRWVEVGDELARLEIDLAFEGALWGGGPGVRPVLGQTIDEGVAAKVTALLGVEQLVLVGFASYDDARWLYGAVYDGHSPARPRQAARRGAVRLSQDAPSEEDVARLSGFLWSGDGVSLDATAVPQTVLPSEVEERVASAETSNEEERDEPGPLLWAGIGVGAGAVVLGAVAAGALAFFALSSSSTAAVGRFDLEVVK